MKLWHYTIPQYLPGIREHGALTPATAHVPKDEKPAVWFSARQRWEPTAAKAGLRTLDEMVQVFGPMLRFGIDPDRTLPWRKLVIATGMSDVTRRGLEKVGRHVGADPADWFGVVGAVLLDDLVMQQYNGEEWIEWQP
jgi:hypothetical protein